MKKQKLKEMIKSLRAHIVVVVLLVGILPATLFSVLFSSLYVRRSVESDVTDMVANGQRFQIMFGKKAECSIPDILVLMILAGKFNSID